MEVNFAGSNQIAHIVDCVLFLESDRETPLKFLRAAKNRFGDVNEVGVFQHTESGLEGVSDPSGILIDIEGETPPGAAITIISEGVRQMPVEIQILVVTSNLASPRRKFNGVNDGRAQIVCAILEKFCRANLSSYDVFGSTISAVKVLDPMADLAIAAAALSSLKNITPQERMAFVGELSPTGQVRGTMMMNEKVKEAERLGFDHIVMPKPAKNIVRGGSSIRKSYISNVSELLGILGR